MPVLNMWPVVIEISKVLSPFVPYMMGAALALVAAWFGFNLAKRELLRRRRRPAAPKSSRSMIVASRDRQPVLDGQFLEAGDLLELRHGGHGAVEWVRCELRRVRGVWSLVLPNGQAVAAIGNRARWPPALLSAERKAQLRRVRHCVKQCPTRFHPDDCASCPTKFEVAKLRAREYLPPELSRLLH